MYEGEYLGGKRNGKGKEFRYDQLIFEGEYLNDEKWNGKGKEYEGEYLNRERWNGKLKEYDYEGKLMFKENILMDQKMIKELYMKMIK